MPIIQQANAELEATIRSEGVESVQIDANIRENSSDGGIEFGEQAELEESVEGTATIHTEDGQLKKNQTIVLEFATGDFDGSAIAQAEEEDKEQIDSLPDDHALAQSAKEGGGVHIEKKS